MVNELLQDDSDPEKIVRQKDELKVKLLHAQSVIAECKAGLADLERRLERPAISLRIDERHRSSAPNNSIRDALPREPRSIDDPVDQETAVAFSRRSRDR